MPSTGAARGGEVRSPWLPEPRRRNRTYSPSAPGWGQRLPVLHTLTPAKYPADGAPDAHPSPGPEPRLEIEIKEWTKRARGRVSRRTLQVCRRAKASPGAVNGGRRIEDLGHEEGQSRIEGAGDVDGMASPSIRVTLLHPLSSTLRRASSSISGLNSRPMMRPCGPTSR